MEPGSAHLETAPPTAIDASAESAGDTHVPTTLLLRQALSLAGEPCLTPDEAISFGLQQAGLGEAIYAAAIYWLCGLRVEVADGKARWDALLAHRLRLERALERPVSLLAAAADCFEQARPSEPRLVLVPVPTFDRMLTSSQIDPSTGLLNAASFRWVLDSELGRARRYRKNTVLILASLDNLATLREDLGADCAGLVMRDFGALLSDNLRTTDTAARLDDETYALLLPECKVDDGRKRASTLQLKAQARPPLPGSEVRVSASFGVAGFPRNASDADSLIESARIALLRAQEMGGNRVEHD